MRYKEIKYLQTVSAKGKTYFYYRREGQSFKLPAPDHPKFMTAYARAANHFDEQILTSYDTFEFAAQEYLKSSRFKKVAASSKKLYRGRLDTLRGIFGTTDIKDIKTPHVIRLQDKYLDRPGAWNTLAAVMSNVFSEARRRGMCDHDPMKDVPALEVGTYKAWPDYLVDHVRSNVELDVRRIIDLAVFTGQRRGDLAKMRWSDWKRPPINEIWVKQQKTGKELKIPVHRDLDLNAFPKDAVTILQSRQGKPYTVSGLSSRFDRGTAHLDLTGYVFHGLRKSAAVRLAEAGCTPHEIKSVTGHETIAMVEEYTKDAEQRRLARAAFDRLERD